MGEEHLQKTEPTPDLASADGVVTRFRRTVHRYVPSNFNSIAGLAKRLLLDSDSAGRMAMVYSAAGLLLTPLDLAMQPYERRLQRQATPPTLPQIFVCGAPRSGTTLVGQVLMKHLPVFYLSNLTSLFPRSPVTAIRIFGRDQNKSKARLGFTSFYGRTSRPGQPNDALYLWDRWTGSDRSRIPEAISPEDQNDLVSFFGALEGHTGLPLVNKNNALNTYAHLVADILPTARFVCLDRDPLYLAQSHFVARQFIHGDEHVSYGIRGAEVVDQDPIEDICRQVLFHRDRAREEQQRIGSDRFLVLPYEDFCARPAYWVNVISERYLRASADLKRLESELPPFRIANRRKIDTEMFHAIETRLRELDDQ